MLSLAKHAHSGLLLNVEELSWDESNGMLQGRVDGQVIYLTMDQMIDEHQIQIKVESKDVIVATQKLSQSSLQNCFITTIEQIEKISISHILLTLNLGQQKLHAKITVKSLNELQLSIGQAVYSYIKAVRIVGDIS